ncbi:universal stress protein [Streptomyces sp. 7R007]
MSGSSTGRVIVGVDDSPAGRCALHAAVAQARELGRELVSVRAYPAPAGGGTAWRSAPVWRMPRLPRPPTSEPRHRLRVACEERELSAVTRLFEQALGGVPHDVRVHPVAVVGPPGPVLVAVAHREDLLVVGKPHARRPRRLWPWRWFRSSTHRYCVRHATCPVLTVPARERVRWTVDGRRHPHPPLDGSDAMGPPLQAGAESLAAETEGGGTNDWPTRACCCSAPPRVQVLVPVRDGRPADLYLCGRHYRACIGPLALADATVRFRGRSPTGHG